MIAQALGATLLHSLWQIALLVLILAGLSPVLSRRSAQARYLIYCMALLAIPVASLATFLTLYDNPGAGPVEALASAPLWQPETPVSLLARYAPWLVGLWLVGVAICTTRVVYGCMQVRRLRESARPLPDALAPQIARSLARLADDLKVGAKVAIAQSVAVSVPTLVGWLRPVILLPAGLITQLSQSELEAVIAHELGHVRRLDPLVNVLQSLIEALFFYHPGTRWLSRRIREEREYCCDDLAVRVAGDPVAYAYALTELEAQRAVNAPYRASLSAATATAIDPKGGPLMQRIRRIVQPSSHSVRVSSWFMPGFLALVIASAALVSACEADDETDPTVEEIHATGAAVFVDENGNAQQVSGDHVWFSYRGPHADGNHTPGDGEVHGSVVIKLAHGEDGALHAHEGHEVPAAIADIIKERHQHGVDTGERHAAFVHEDGQVVELTDEDLRKLHEQLQAALHGERADGHPKVTIESVEDPTAQ